MKRKLQVFVSSTFNDLKEERQAAVAAILKAGHIPAGMELFTAGDVSQMETINRWIDESDVYMLILGGRYGSVEPKTSLSYTELEYDYAKAQGKPLFAVVIEEAALEARVKAGGTSFIEKQNPKSLEQFRAKVLGNISSFFSDTKDIKLCVYESLSDLAAKPDLKGWVSASEVPDTQSLNAEIEKLRSENRELSAEIKRLLSNSANQTTAGNVSYDELANVLKAIQIEVPANLAESGKPFTTSLFNVAMSSIDTLTNGVHNKINMEETAKFYYFNVFPKLQMHGLADNERVPGVQYRRSVLNKKGREFFAHHERLRLLATPAPKEPKKSQGKSPKT